MTVEAQPKRPLVKICGVTRPEDVEAAVALGADLLGLNFYPPSPRFLDTAKAADLARAARDADPAGGVGLVGVFVDADPDEIRRLDDTVGFDLIQFHGRETPADLLPFGRRVVRVFRRRELPDGQELDAYDGAWGFLFDVPHTTFPGGTGETWNYGSLAGLSTAKPVLVAGGIGPDNARRALAESGATGIDVCSGVESTPGVKDLALMTRLFEEVRRDGQSRED